ncbi:unnamed protein product [Orchesella dallaii]|uniref:Uncharacterized protein n=1 Tax=Orchesella dallaii TaxID=48710 RepID=A0ABP1RVJ4_9HEXA
MSDRTASNEEEIPQMNLNEFHNLHNNMQNGEAQQPAGGNPLISFMNVTGDDDYINILFKMEEILHTDEEEDVAAEEDEGFDDDDDEYVPPPRRDETPPPPIIEVRRGARNRVQTVYFQATFKSQLHH